IVPAWRLGNTKNLTKSCLASWTYALVAPVLSAFSWIVSKSRSLPTSTVTQMTSRLYVSCSHLMATEVSRPPEYARMTLSISSRSRPEACRIRVGSGQQASRRVGCGRVGSVRRGAAEVRPHHLRVAGHPGARALHHH